jgi:molybdopterin synthase catalytic subunit
MALSPKHSVDALLEIPEGVCAITHAPLDVDAIIGSVGDPGAGGTAVFIGTTRNSFKGARAHPFHLPTLVPWLTYVRDVQVR